MAIKHQRLGLLARWFRYCPECGGWFSLRLVSKEHNALTGKRCDFKCSKCEASMQDWQPSDAVKFAHDSTLGDGVDIPSDSKDQSVSSGENSCPEGREPAANNLDLWSLAGMLMLVAAAQLGSYFIFDGGWLILLALSGMFAIFVYAHISEFHLFARRAVMDAAFEKDGVIHHYLYKAWITRVVLFFLSFFFSGSFLLHANQMSLVLWGIIYLDAVIIFALLRLTGRQVARQTKQPYSYLLGRRYIFWLNFVLLTILICGTSFYLPVSDTRSLSLLQSATMAWDQVWQSTSDPLLGWWGGMIAAVDSVVWNIMQQVSQWDISSMVKFMSWVVFFAVFQAAYLWFIQSAMLGVLIIRERSGSWADRILGKSSAAKWGWGIFYLLIIVWMTLGVVLGVQQQNQPQKLSLNVIEAPAPEKVVIDPCIDIAQHEMNAVTQTLDQQMAQDNKDYTAAINPYIDEQINRAFAYSVRGVDAYLDWYFTVAGEWERLGTVVVGDIGTLMNKKLTQLVSEESGFKQAVQAAHKGISGMAGKRFMQAQQHMIMAIRNQVDVHPCSVDQKILVPLPSLSRDMKRIALTATTTAAAGTALAMTAGAAITTKLAATASAKIATKVLTKLAVKTAAKAAAGATGVTAGALLGLSCGPWFWICSPALAAISFVSIDAVFMEGDEMLNRNDMRTDMVQALMKQRDRIKAQQKADYHKAGDQFFGSIAEKSHAYFMPARDGI